LRWDAGWLARIEPVNAEHLVNGADDTNAAARDHDEARVRGSAALDIRGRRPIGQAAPYRLPAARVAQIDDYVDGLAWRLRSLGTA